MDEITRTIFSLIKNGFVVDEWKMKNGAIIGGVSRQLASLQGINDFYVYQEAFTISTNNDEFIVRTCNRGQLVTETVVSSLDEAVDFIIEEYKK